MAKKNGNILIVDDNRGVLTALQLLLKPYFEGIITLPRNPAQRIAGKVMASGSS